MLTRRSRAMRSIALPMCLGLVLVSAAHSYPTIATPDGYAAGTTGGQGGRVVEVSTASEFKAACESSEKLIVVVTKDLGSIGQVTPKSNKTIVGANASAGYDGNMNLSGVSNIIVQNLTIRNPGGVGTSDGIEASSGTTKVFVTKCHFIDNKDGAFDIKRGSDFITVSWCRFSYPTITGHNFPNLIGHSDDNAAQDKGKLHVTMHHNWYDKGCESRMPRVRFGTVHVYNNFYQNASTYAVGTGVYSTIRLENSIFQNIGRPWNDMAGMANGAKIGWSNLSMTEGTKTPTYAPNSWPVFTPPYPFALEPLASLKAVVTNPTNGAGNTFGATTGIEGTRSAADSRVVVDFGVLKLAGGQAGDRIVVRDPRGAMVAEFGSEGGALPAAAFGVLLVEVHSLGGRTTRHRIMALAR